MKLLIIGGTLFLGRYLVEAAVARDHEVTLFNRGKSNPDLFPSVEKLRGDRKIDLSLLRNRQWDAVIDTCGFLPRHVSASARLLADAVEHYTFISSVSVYRDVSKPGTKEGDPLQTLEDETDEVTGETYGPLKVLCEEAAENAMPGRVLNIRPGLIVGPHDYSWRFPYWVKRVSEGGEVLAPGSPEKPLQFIDARDLAEWNVRMVEARRVGIYNAAGPDYRLSMGQFLDTCKSVSASDATFTWVSAEFLQKENIAPWQQMPLFIPEGEGSDGMMAIDISKALAAGLTFRPLSDTVRDTLAWVKTLSMRQTQELPAGIPRELETTLLEKWHQLSQK